MITNKPFLTVLIIAVLAFAPFVFAMGGAGGTMGSGPAGNGGSAGSGGAGAGGTAGSPAGAGGTFGSGGAGVGGTTPGGSGAASGTPSSPGGSSASGGVPSSPGSSAGGPGFPIGGPPGFPGTPGGFPGGFPPNNGGGGFPSEVDAVWTNPLEDVTLLKGSPNKIIQERIDSSRCFDADTDTLTFKIASTHKPFDLTFTPQSDLLLYNLDKDFVGTETVVITCNGIPDKFNVNVVDKTPPRRTTPREPVGDTDRLSIHIGAIRIPTAYDSMPGDIIPVTLTLRNNGDESLDNVKAAVMIPSLGLRDSVGPFDLTIGKSISRTMALQLPADTEPGLYYARITVDSGSVHRTVHRDIEVTYE